MITRRTWVSRGSFPYTRGINPSMNRGEPFNVRIYSGFGNAEDSNERYKKILAWGADEVQIASDLPGQIGYDSDHIMSKGEIGRVGVAINSLQDMEILFDGIPLNSFKRVGILGNSTGPICAGAVHRPGREAGAEARRLCGRSAKRSDQGVYRPRDLHLSDGPGGSFCL